MTAHSILWVCPLVSDSVTVYIDNQAVFVFVGYANATSMDWVESVSLILMDNTLDICCMYGCDHVFSRDLISLANGLDLLMTID